ncbi:MAG: sodium-translocating pyrophosphatase, partial [Patescibacteria group bacterium]
GNAAMQEISKAIQEGSRAYLNRQYKAVAAVAALLILIIYYFLGWEVALGFFVGASASAVAGYIGMNVAVRANTKTAAAAERGMAPALSLAFRAGSVTGFLVAALAILSTAIFYFVFPENISSLIGLGFGASLISVFARLGGGIYTKAADVGTDLVGKVEANIPEDDPRNPGVIADLTGDNVSDCAGMAADIFETIVVSLIAALLLIKSPLPLVIASVALIASLIGGLFVKLGRGSIMGALYKGLGATVVISVALFYGVLNYFIPDFLNIFYSLLIGLAVAVAMVVVTDYYTAQKYRPVKSISEASRWGHGTNIIIGLSVGMEATFAPILIIVGGILASYYFSGIVGVALAVTAMLSVAGIIVAIDSFGPITDNAGGIAEMTGASEHVRKVTDALDAVGNTTKAVTKGYAIASAGLAALVLFNGFTNELSQAIAPLLVLQNPWVVAGLFLGAALPYLFSSMTMKAVGETAGAVVDEIRRQFREIPGIMDRTAKPDYARAVDIVTQAALKKMILPITISIVLVLIVGFFLGSAALGGFLIGSIISGLFLGLSMTTGGAAWDNAKKHIEEGHHGGKGSEAHKAAITGDTVGDPYKDTAGPAINPLIKVINIIALLLVPFL